MPNLSTINIFFSGTSFNESLGNGLFQIIFYSFKGQSVTLVHQNALTAEDKKLFIKQARQFEISLSFKFENQFAKTNSLILKIGRRFVRFGFPSRWLMLIGGFVGVFYLVRKTSGAPLIVLSPMDLHKLSPKLMLRQRKILIIADLLFRDFPEQFDKNEVDAFVFSTQKLLGFVDKIVCFSEHVKERHLIPILGVPEEKIQVIPHVKHDLSPLLNSSPLIKDSGLETAKSIIEKTKKFTKSQKKRIMTGRYLISCSTYRKPYKGFETLEAIQDLLRDQSDLFIVATNVPDVSKKKFLENKNIVPKDKLDAVELAAVYKVAAGAVHCSHFEGGINVAPFTEAVSLGVPCIFQKSHATQEAGLTRLLGEFDVNEEGSLQTTLNRLLNEREHLFNLQRSYFSNLKYDERQKLAKWDHAING